MLTASLINTGLELMKSPSTPLRSRKGWPSPSLLRSPRKKFTKELVWVAATLPRAAWLDAPMSAQVNGADWAGVVSVRQV